MNNKLTAYVGTYTTGESKGIYRFTLDLLTGKIENINLAAEIGNPTYLCIDKNNKYLYSVAKVENAGGVASFSIDADSEKLALINYQISEGNPPCHVSLDKKGSYLFSANYHKGEASVFLLSKDGSINPPSSIVKHEGSGPNEKRQEKPHAHYISLTPDERHVCAVDLGIDKIVAYDFNNGILSKSDELTLTLNPGCGPRHMVFHPNKNFAYILTELSSEVIALKYSPSDNTFKVLQYISSLPEDFTGENLGSAIHISSDGKYLYAANRGHNSIAVFAMDLSSGKLQLVDHTFTQGSEPRDFCLDPTGKYLIAANQTTNNIVPFKIDNETGKLIQINNAVTIPSPVCIKFLNL